MSTLGNAGFLSCITHFSAVQCTQIKICSTLYISSSTLYIVVLYRLTAVLTEPASRENTLASASAALLNALPVLQ